MFKLTFGIAELGGVLRPVVLGVADGHGPVALRVPAEPPLAQSPLEASILQEGKTLPFKKREPLNTASSYQRRRLASGSTARGRARAARRRRILKKRHSERGSGKSF